MLFAPGPAYYVAGPALRVQPWAILLGHSSPPGPFMRVGTPICCIWNPLPSTMCPPLEISPLFHLLESVLCVSEPTILKRAKPPNSCMDKGNLVLLGHKPPRQLPSSKRKGGGNPLTLLRPTSLNASHSLSLHQGKFPECWVSGISLLDSHSLKLAGVIAPI